MSRTSGNGMHAVRCDWKPAKGTDYVGPGYCSEIFRSFCLLSVIVDQLVAAGWYVEGERSRQRAPVHLCPEHKPRTPGWNISATLKRSESG